jgi:hypothetical protein
MATFFCMPVVVVICERHAIECQDSHRFRVHLQVCIEIRRSVHDAPELFLSGSYVDFWPYHSIDREHPSRFTATIWCKLLHAFQKR